MAASAASVVSANGRFEKLDRQVWVDTASSMNQ
jgi:hypothetical protein